MALLMQKQTDEGFVVSYWVIESIKLDREKRAVLLNLIPYASKELYDAGGKPFLPAKMNIQIEDILYPSPAYGVDMPHYTDYFSPAALEGKNIYAVAYDYIKLHIPAFAEAKDI